MKKIILLCILPIFFHSAHAQFSDNFNRTHLRYWKGDTSDFTITPDSRLQLHTTGSGHARLFRTVDALTSPFYSGHIELDFAPSATNKLSIELGHHHGSDTLSYFLEIGNTGSPDSLYLIARSSGTTQHWPHEMTFENSVFMDYEIRIDGLVWHIKVTNDQGLSKTTSITAGPAPNKAFDFGINCHFTASRSEKFFFDDILVGRQKSDTLPPVLDTAWIVDPHSAILLFDENVALPKPEDWNSLPHSSWNSVQYTSDSLGLLLHFDDSLHMGKEYACVLSISDTSGNRDTVRFPMIFYPTKLALPGEIFITEMMADPSPSYGLPEGEYIELYNASTHYLNLADYTLADDQRQAILPQYYLGPGEICFVIDKANRPMYEGWPGVVTVDNLPTINNDADQILLLDYVGRILYEMDFDRSFYDIKDQSQGGWSLEMIDLAQPCLKNKNWTTADFHQFGSPGQPNTTSGRLPYDDPTIRWDLNKAGDLLTLYLDRNIYPGTNPEITVNPHVGITSMKMLDAATIECQLDTALSKEHGYIVTFAVLNDCQGKSMVPTRGVPIFVPDAPKKDELRINEVLFQPRSGGVDFIELKNEGKRHLKLENLCLEKRTGADSSIVCWPNLGILPPREVLAIAKDTSILHSHYHCGTLAESSLPSLTDDATILILHDYVQGKKNILDSTDYHTSMHSPALTSKEGFSLKRWSQYPESNISWISTSSAYDGATPGFEPDTSHLHQQQQPQVMHLTRDDFSPNNDGYNDVLVLDISLLKNGFYGRIDIFDIDGHSVSQCLNDALINKSMQVLWLGNGWNNVLLPAGVYILSGVFVHPDGDVITEKITCILN